MDQPPVIRRRVARVLLFDERDRLLMLFDPDPDRGQYWYPPGGRVEPGESPEEAARRELREEIGLDAELGGLVLRRRARFTYGDRRFDQDEWHFAVRTSEPVAPVSRPGDSEAGAVAAHRWWSLSELRASNDRFFPEGLADAVGRFLEVSGAGGADGQPAYDGGVTTPAAPSGEALTALQQDLIALLGATRSAEHDLFEALGEAGLASPVGEEGWTAKDVRAHLAAWRSIEARQLLAAAGIRATAPNDPPPGQPVDESNARIQSDRSAWTPSQVAQAADASIDELADAIRASSNEALCECDQIAAGIGANGVNHALGHLSDIARLAGAEDRYAAFASEVEAVLARNHLLPRDSGVMLYNIACHNALTGRTDDARRLLATAFARRADLLEYAVDDPDLASLDQPSA